MQVSTQAISFKNVSIYIGWALQPICIHGFVGEKYDFVGGLKVCVPQKHVEILLAPKIKYTSLNLSSFNPVASSAPPLLEMSLLYPITRTSQCQTTVANVCFQTTEISFHCL